MEYRQPNVTVPSKVTTYLNTYIEVPDDQAYHITGFQVVVDRAEFLHHFVVVCCTKQTVKQKMWEGYDNPDGCDEVVWAWGPGGDTFLFPHEAGYPFGPWGGGDVGPCVTP